MTAPVPVTSADLRYIAEVLLALAKHMEAPREETSA